MNVIGHDDEFVKEEFSFVAIVRERVDKKIGSGVKSEDRLTMGCDRGNEESAGEIHFGMFVAKGLGCL